MFVPGFAGPRVFLAFVRGVPMLDEAGVAGLVCPGKTCWKNGCGLYPMKMACRFSSVTPAGHGFSVDIAIGGLFYPSRRKTASTSARGRSSPLTRIFQRCVLTATGVSGAKSSAVSASVK